MQCQRYDVAVELDKKKTVNDKLSFLSIFSWRFSKMTVLSLTVFKKTNWQACITRLEILRTKMQNFQNPHKDWRAAFLKVRTNGLAKL